VTAWITFVDVIQIRLTKMKNYLFRYIVFAAHSSGVTTKTFRE